MKTTGGVLLLLLGAWSLLVGSCSVLHAGAGGPSLFDALIALSGLLCLAAAPLYFLERVGRAGRLFALLAPLVAVAAEGLSLLLYPPWIGLVKIGLLLLAGLTGFGIGRGTTKDLPAGA